MNGTISVIDGTLKISLRMVRILSNNDSEATVATFAGHHSPSYGGPRSHWAYYSES
jgi:hypothetical protein